jgi:hypothetical protein
MTKLSLRAAVALLLGCAASMALPSAPASAQTVSDKKAAETAARDRALLLRVRVRLLNPSTRIQKDGSVTVKIPIVVSDGRRVVHVATVERSGRIKSNRGSLTGPNPPAGGGKAHRVFWLGEALSLSSKVGIELPSVIGR